MQEYAARSFIVVGIFEIATHRLLKRNPLKKSELVFLRCFLYNEVCMITLYSSSAEQPVLAPLHVKSATSNELYVFCSSSLREVLK